jgi:hypothetical protein
MAQKCTGQKRGKEEEAKKKNYDDDDDAGFSARSDACLSLYIKKLVCE